MKLSSPAFKHKTPIPAKYTCDGENISPELHWSETPEGTVSYVLICDDPDAIPVCGHTFDHWILYNIPATITALAENESAGLEGMTHFGKPGYGGPCPPNGLHTYIFKIYALDTLLDLDAGADKKAVEVMMEGHILDQAELLGTYDRLL